MGLLGMLGRKGSARHGGDYENAVCVCYAQNVGTGSPSRGGEKLGKRDFETLISEAISRYVRR
eukprot:1195837-Prorocentrum_minimum.AAC.1